MKATGNGERCESGGELAADATATDDAAAPINGSSAALRASEIRYRRLFETAKDGVLIVDPETRRIVAANPFMAQLLCCGHEEFVGKEMSEIGLFGDELAIEETFRRLHDEHEVCYDHLPLMGKDGSAHEVEVVANLYDEGGQPTVQCIVRDITKRRRVENKIAAHSAELEAQVQARTRELRATIGELEAFFYCVSHDMRAPLRAMQGYGHLLLQSLGKTLDADSRDYLHRITAAAARLDALIGDVLVYSSLLRSEVVLQSVDLEEVVHRVIATYPQLHAEGVQITMAGPLGSVMANDASLTQVFSNLLTNAVKFVAPGVAPRIRVHAESLGDDVRVWIEDNGIGIDPKDGERIWARFTRIGRVQDYDGTGVGLSIARKAVERMQGTIGVESAQGQGSRFWFRLHRA